jgi:hypothetical protein
MDRIASQYEMSEAQYWSGVALQAQLLSTGLVVANAPGAAASGGDWRAAKVAALEREIQAYEELADYYAGKLDVTMANIYMERAAQTRARLDQ